ncbi:hypothetical protein K488DRAFT_70801 [Vararia minispora EC-137]|uniref:Uncharacterized protein n=1 Tax=Vararia minispora EC-137 TaxID=1314806 RepID=A0ACB8QKL4_9AGAM|nr:hypothetical protein K488DRAFT_70801 [Vararia minispora EC-137]
MKFWDKEKSPPPGASFLPDNRSSRSYRPKTAPGGSTSVFPAFRKQSADGSFSSPSTSSASPPIITLKLSSISFLDSVIHDGISDNPLYVIETEVNHTKIRRSDPKGFINVARVLWRENTNYFSRSKKDLSGTQLAFGKGQWKPADEFLGFSYSSLSNHLKFYLPHHPHSLRWKRMGTALHCTTQSVKGPVAILETSYSLTPPQLKIFNPIFPEDASRQQRMHAGIPLSLLDFLLVTSMLLLTDPDEWTNITRLSSSNGEPSASADTTNADGVEAEVEAEADEGVLSPSHPVSQSPVPGPAVSPTPHPRSRAIPYVPSHNQSQSSVGSSGMSGSVRNGASGIERWRNDVDPHRPNSPDEPFPRPDSGSGIASPAQDSRRQSRSSAGSESNSGLTSPINPRFSHRSSSSGSHRAPSAFASSPSVARELPIPPVPANPYITQGVSSSPGPVPHLNSAGNTLPSPSASMLPRPPSPSPPPSAFSQPMPHASPTTAAWESASPITPGSSSYSGSSLWNVPSTARMYTRPQSSSSSSTHYNLPMTPARALPPVPLPPPPVPSPQRTPSKSSLPSSPAVRAPPPIPMPSQSTNGHVLTPSRSTPHLRRDPLGTVAAVKTPPQYVANALDRTRSEFGSAELAAAAGRLGIADAGGAAAGQGAGRDNRTEGYEAPPPAYSQHDFERSPFRMEPAAAAPATAAPAATHSVDA